MTSWRVLMSAVLLCDGNEDEAAYVAEFTGARSEPGKIAKLIGHSGKTTAFAVVMASVEKRLLEGGRHGGGTKG